MCRFINVDSTCRRRSSGLDARRFHATLHFLVISCVNGKKCTKRARRPTRGECREGKNQIQFHEYACLISARARPGVMAFRRHLCGAEKLQQCARSDRDKRSSGLAFSVQRAGQIKAAGPTHAAQIADQTVDERTSDWQASSKSQSDAKVHMTWFLFPRRFLFFFKRKCLAQTLSC